MAADDVYPAEMPDHPAPPTLPLDDDTAERLLAARLDPADAPPGYAGVARLLRAAAAPAHPDELAGEPTALAMFRAARSGAVGSTGAPRPGGTAPGQTVPHRGRGGAGPRDPRRGWGGTGPRGRPAGATGRPAGERDRPAGAWGRPTGAWGRPAGAWGRPAGARGRLVALALVGTLVTGAAAVAGGLWTGADVNPAGRLRSPTGGAAAGGPGSGAPGPSAGSGAVASWGLGAGDVRVGRTGEDGRGRPSDLRRRVGVPSARDRVTAHHGGVTSRGGGSAHGIKPGRPATPSKPKPNPSKGKSDPSKPNPSKGKPDTGKPDMGKPATGKPDKARPVEA
jgi:hypothetical protein